MKIEWFKLSELDCNKISKCPGIYFIRWVKNNSPVVINRISRVDYKGILYIGRSRNIKRRIKQIRSAIIENKDIHTIYATMIYCKIQKLIKIDEFEIAWEELNTNNDSEFQEWIAIKLYCEKYNEPPPLNLMLSRELFGIFGLGIFNKSKFASDPDDFVKNILF